MEHSADYQQGPSPIKEFLVALCLCPVASNRGGHHAQCCVSGGAHSG